MSDTWRRLKPSDIGSDDSDEESNRLHVCAQALFRQELESESCSLCPLVCGDKAPIEDLPYVVMGVKDGGLGGFNPYGNEQSSSDQSVLVLGVVYPTVSAAEREMDVLISPTLKQYYTGCVVGLSDYDFKFLLIMVEFGVWSNGIGAWVQELCQSARILEPLRSDLRESWQIFLKQRQAHVWRVAR